MPKVAISACLYGEAVRYDGADKSLQTTLDILSKHLELQPICPEVGAGLGVPRPPVQLVRTDSEELRALGRDDPQLDVTDALARFARDSLTQYGEMLTGYILKSRSPSCGLNSTALFNTQGVQAGWGSGIQADYFHSTLPWLQFVEETGLSSTTQCEAFILRCLVLNDVRHALAARDPGPVLRHYDSLVRMMPPNYQQRLRREDPGLLWQTFGRGLHHLTEP